MPAHLTPPKIKKKSKIVPNYVANFVLFLQQMVACACGPDNNATLIVMNYFWQRIKKIFYGTFCTNCNGYAVFRVWSNGHVIYIRLILTIRTSHCSLAQTIQVDPTEQNTVLSIEYDSCFFFHYVHLKITIHGV